MRKTISALVLLAVPIALSAQSKVAATPAMGWNSWNHFATHVTDKDVRAAADAIVASGMKDAGYIYVNIDDSWEAEKRDAQGNIQTNSNFPDMKALADYVHSKGLKIGIYSSPGPRTCGGYLGSYQHEEQDAKTYAAWGIDYLKYDLCSYGEIMRKAAPNNQAKQYEMMRAAYEKMHKALVATGRPIYYSLCQYGWGSVWKWGPTVGGNSWRTTDDIEDSYMSMSNIGFSQAGLSKYAGPGHWNDPDMLEVGNGGMKYNEYLTHMSLWAMLAAPLLAGNDLSKMTPETKSILLNKDVIAIDQDPLGKQGDRVSAEGPFEVWSKPLQNGDLAVALFNRGHDAEQMSLPLAKLGLSASSKVHNVWNPSDNSHGPWMVPEHGVVLLRITK
jgi:alpha-galactosidase